MDKFSSFLDYLILCWRCKHSIQAWTSKALVMSLDTTWFSMNRLISFAVLQMYLFIQVSISSVVSMSACWCFWFEVSQQTSQNTLMCYIQILQHIFSYFLTVWLIRLCSVYWSCFTHTAVLWTIPGLPPGPPPSSMLSYQQQQHLLRRGTASMGQVSFFIICVLLFCML